MQYKNWNLKGLKLLVLSRKPGQTIRVNDDLAFTVIRIEGNQVKIGIQAPKTSSIHRQEIYEAIQRGEPHASNR